ncbi:exonuclease [Aliishimia ponticola]|uniref:DNA-directed DNA polymerase n=1 Tax=Aliishimia ponticola TaxID=2499833 RepID=A0A4S4NDI2_9RHOB|nr:exonuclease domain-containing protein [Aliishimia ponticola]THH36108.1 exonuclease [Aliishimia ponticola]
MRERLGLRLRFALFFAALGLGGAALTALGLWVGWSRIGGPVDGYVIGGLIGGFGIIGLAAWIGLLFDENVAKPILALAADLHTRAQSDVQAQIDVAPARYLGALAPAAQAIHTELEAARKSQAQAFADKTARMARDKALLEALLRDLSHGVVVLSPSRHILLFNAAAAQILGKVGLNRPAGSFLRMDPVEDAIQRRGAAKDADAAPFLTVTADGARILTGAVSTVMAGETRVGDVVMIHDSTEALRTHAEIESLLRDTIEEARRPAMAMGALLDVIEMDPDSAPVMTGALREEAERLSAHLARVSTRREALNSVLWPLSDVDAGDIMAAVAARHPGLTVEDSDMRLHCDGFAITAILDAALHRLAQTPERGDFTLRVRGRDASKRFCLGWTGPGLSQGDLENWLDAPISPAYGPYTARDALEAHRTDMWVGPGQVILLPIPTGTATAPGAPTPDRDFYDFDLPEGGRALAWRPLGDLAYVVFDTETTGLDTARDDVVQIAGVRMVGPRILQGEDFDQLVDPGRPIPQSSTQIHGITQEMVADAPRFDTVAGTFSTYAEDAVLVAHNAKFDMAFLNRIGGFDHPVLCTGQLSAALFDHTDDHTLDALAERFGIEIAEDMRHTALGDALATAEIFKRMLPILAGRGIRTLEDALRFQGRLGGNGREAAGGRA